jgi:phosphoglycerate dehydrogenase-like enzyme
MTVHRCGAMKILIADLNLVPHRKRLEAALPSDTTVHWHDPSDHRSLLDDVRDADVYVGGRFTAAMAEAAEKLRLIHVAGAGTDRVEFTALSDEVLVANTFHHERSIAEYVLAAAIMLRRDFLAQDRALRRGVWATSVYDAAIPQPSALQDANVGFVGIGHIGQQAWNLFRGFGSTGAAVTGSGRVDASAHQLAWAGDTTRLHKLLAVSDVDVGAADRCDRRHDRCGAVVRPGS